jgi:glycosyltransferase involved in cell wall biosynthesis
LFTLHVQVLIIHQFFNTPQSGGALRSYYLARALHRAGHTVHVITTHNHKTYLRVEVGGADVHYLPVTYHNRYGFFKRVYSFLLFVISIIRCAARFRGVSLCYAISAPLTTGLAAMVLKWRYGIPYVFEVGDLWPEAPIQLGVVRNPWLKKMLYALEAAIYRNARCVVGLSPPIVANIQHRFSACCTAVLPNMADTDFYQPGVEETLKAEYGAAGKLVVSYIGTLGRANGLQYLLHCACACKQKNLPVTFILCGDGAEKEALMDAAVKMKLDNVLFLPFRNREGVRALYRITDVAMVCFKPLPVLETGSPNKYYDALAAGKAVAVNFGGWIREEIERHGCGFFAAHEEDFAKKIEEYLNHPQALRQAQEAARQLAQQYSCQLLEARFVEIINRCAEAKK